MRAAIWTCVASVGAALLAPAVEDVAVEPVAPHARFDLQDNCKPENRGKAINKLLEPWKEHYHTVVQQAFTGLDGPAMLTIGDGHANALFFNFMAHVQRTAIKSSLHFSVVNVALDSLAYKACEAVQKQVAEYEANHRHWWNLRRPKHSTKLKCVTLEGWLPIELFQHNEHAGVRGTGTCSYNMIIGTKPHILKAAVNASDHGVLMIDTDVVVRGDIMKESMERLLLKKDASLVTAIENHATLKINTGTVFTAKSGRFAYQILDEWIKMNGEFLNDDHGDQAALQAVFNTNHRLWQYAVTYGEAVGQCSRPAPVATHYNCYANKLAPMQKQGDWDVDAQKSREKLGLFNSKDVAEMSELVQAKIDAMQAADEWIQG